MAFLEKDIQADSTELDSGTIVPMKCKESTKVLNGTFRNFSIECLHGSFQTCSNEDHPAIYIRLDDPNIYQWLKSKIKIPNFWSDSNEKIG